jgi:inward rectifier potassium channel
MDKVPAECRLRSNLIGPRSKFQHDFALHAPLLEVRQLGAFYQPRLRRRLSPVSRGVRDLFYFSIETLATVGYGDMHPQTHFGHVVATTEIFIGMSLLAVMTGLIFARFSRPRARFVFAQKAIVTMHDRQPTLMIRVANARHNTLSNASATLWLIRAEHSAEGQHLRRYYQLELLRQENPVFALTWTIFHVIDQTSPLFGLSDEELASTDTVLMPGNIDTLTS